MKNTADIRKLNKKRIRSIFWRGDSYTKQQIAKITGLSVATCNTLLNELLASGEIIGEKTRSAEVGRSAMRYQLNESYESILCVTFEMVNNKRHLAWWLLSLKGNVIKSAAKDFEHLDYEKLNEQIKELFSKYKNISEIVVGVPGIAEHGVISHCDIPELNEVALVKELTTEFNVSITMENDMHLKAYGLYKLKGIDKDVITLANFPVHIMPGTASVSNGMIIKGANQFAGMVGFLPYGISQEEYLAQLAPKTSLPLISQALVSLITIINPSTLVLTGNLIEEKLLETLKEDCKKYIPANYLPQFSYCENTDEYYLAGMYQQVLNKREEVKNDA